MRQMSRRSFAFGGLAALLGLGGWSWLRTRAEEDGIPWNELEFSESANEKTAHPQITDDFKIKVYKQLLTR